MIYLNDKRRKGESVNDIWEIQLEKKNLKTEQILYILKKKNQLKYKKEKKMVKRATLSKQTIDFFLVISNFSIYSGKRT